jgi:uncharacterized membrane protein
MNQSENDRRIDHIEQRLRRIESVLGFEAVRPTAPEPLSAAQPVVSQLHKLREEMRRVPAGAVTAPEPVLEELTPIEQPAHAPPPLPIHPSPRAPVIPYRRAPKKTPVINHGAIEQTIGLKWAGWIGAVVLVIGAGLGIKFAYDQGWLGAVPPAIRLSMMCIAGLGLIAAGEWVYHKINVLSAVGLYGAGVAILFLVSYAGHAFYGLYERDTAFTFMVLSTLVGAAVAMRGRLVSIAVLSLIGGNLAPALLHGDHPQTIGFLSYLLMLQVVALVLAWWGSSRKWWTLRGVSFAGTALWMMALLGSQAYAATDPPLWFSLVYAGLYQAELILSGIRKKRRNMPLDATAGLQFSILVTAALAVVTLYLFHDASHEIRAMWLLAYSGITGILALALSRKKGEVATLDYLAASFGIQSAALLAVVIPVALSGIWIAAGWGVLAIAFAFSGMIFDLRVARYSAALTWMLAICKIILWTQGIDGHSHAGEIWFNFLGQNIPAYAVMTWLLAITGHIIALIVGRREQSLGGAVHWFAAVLWAISTLIALPPLGASAWLIAYAWILAITDIVAGDAPLLPQAMTLLLLTALKWVLLDTLWARVSPGWTPGHDWPVLNPVMGTGTFIAVSIAGVYRLRRQHFAAAMAKGNTAVGMRLALVLSIALLLTYGFSLEIDRAVEQAVAASVPLAWPAWQLKQMCWTMLWCLVICIFATSTSKLEPSPTRRNELLGTAGVLVALLGMKFLLIDTLMYRINSGPGTAAALANLQMLTGMVVAGALVWIRTLNYSAKIGTSGITFLVVLILLWTGSLEIDRAFQSMARTGTGPFINPQLAEQVALSIFWSLFAIGAVAVGFYMRLTMPRYFGLGLFAVTLLKVVIVDLSQVSTGYRILSFIGLGALLLITSVLYGKVSPLLLHPATAGDTTSPNQQE